MRDLLYLTMARANSCQILDVGSDVELLAHPNPWQEVEQQRRHKNLCRLMRLARGRQRMVLPTREDRELPEQP